MLHIHKLLVAVLGQAVRWRLIAVNAARDVVAPRPRRSEVRTLDVDEMGRLLGASDGSELRLQVLVWLTTGLRRGELLGMKWSDIDRERERLVVARSVEETRVGVSMKSPKTARSTRVVPLPGTVLGALREHEVRQKRQRLAAGPAWQDLGLVFPDEAGGIQRPRNVTKAFGALARRAGISDVSIHSLRHTHVTELLRAGINPKVVSERVGHSSVAFTLQRYAHALPDMQRDAADEAERLVARMLAR
jgi:integrase